MKEMTKKLFKAPWSDQKVGLFARVLAWIFLICGVFFLFSFTYYTFVEGISSEQLLPMLSLVSGISYLCLLFGHVAFKGRAPAGWLPWIQY